MKRILSLQKFPVFTALLVLAFGLPGASLFAEVSAPGVPHLFQVDEHVYRGAQPSREGFENLARLGVKTVIDLREPGERSAWEEKAVKAAGMRYVNIPMKGLFAPTNEQISTALALLNDPSAGPVFVHCRKGMDRTGVVIACYRIQHYHWRAKQALKEAKERGMHWMEFAKREYVRDYAGVPAESPALASVGQ